MLASSIPKSKSHKKDKDKNPQAGKQLVDILGKAQKKSKKNNDGKTI